MRIRPQLIHHWLFIMLLVVILMIGHSLGAWAADQATANRAAAAATPTPKAKGKATPTAVATEETSASDATPESKAAAGDAQLPQEEEATKPLDTLEDAPKAVVQIEAVGTFMDPQEGMQRNAAGAGSGFIIDPSGIAVTNNHVATGAAFLKVFVAGEKEPRNARVLGVSECSDLAVIDIEGEGFPYLAWHSGQAAVGLKVYALGFPLGDPEFTMTDGIISKAKADGETSWASVGHVLEHTATINPGNSGGPLVDKDGRVVGINYAGNADTKQYFAIAGADAQAVIKELRAGNNVDTIGINGEAVNDGKDLAGIWVSSIASGSPADKAELKAGDIVLTMEGVTLADQGTMTEYCNILRSHQPDDVLSIQVLRMDTKEMLEGQINGRALAPSVSVANEVQKEEGSDTSASSGGGSGNDYVDYSTISTKDNVLSVDVPKEWADIQEGDWKIDDQVVGTQLAASPDLKKFFNSWGTAGALVSYSQSLAQTKEPQDLLNDIDYSSDCKNHSDQTELPEGYFTGYFQRWEDCGDTKTQAVLVALTPTETHDYVVLIEIYIVNQAELKALDHIIDSFVVRDQNTETSSDTNDNQTKGSDITDIVDTSGLTYNYQFVNESAISALLPKDWSDTATGDWVVDGTVYGKTYTAAPDIKKFQKSWTEPGIYVRTATNLDKEIDVKEWLDALDLSDKCKNEGRTKHTHTIYDLTYTGAYDVWSNCEKSGNAYAYLVVASDPPGQLVAIEFQALDDADVEAFKVLLKSFFVDTGEQTSSTTAGNTNSKKDEVDLSQYTVINDDTGALSVRVPKAWSDVSSGDWNMDDKKVGLSLSAATDLKEYNDNWNTPGMFLGVSTELAKTTDAKTFLDSWDYSKDCTRDSRIDYDDTVYAGAYDIWKDCAGEQGNLFIVVSVMPKAKSDVLILINVAIPAGTETQPFEQILSTFDYNESGSAVTNNTESNNTETEPNTGDTQGSDSADNAPTVEIVAATLNVRSGPGTNYAKTATAKQGQKFTVIGQVNNCAWLKISDSSGQEGWVAGAAQYVALDTDCANIPQAQAPAAPSTSTSGNNGAATSGNTNKGCYNFQNNVGKELTITFTRADGKWNKTFKVPKSGQHEECFDPGKYTYTMSAPGFESGNNEMIINKGDNYNFPINVKN